MDGTIDWLRDRPRYEGQILTHRRLPAREPTYDVLELGAELSAALAERGVERF